jgi:hypothetical protein
MLIRRLKIPLEPPSRPGHHPVHGAVQTARNAVTGGIRSLGRRLQRSSSSSAPACAAENVHREGRERHRRNRDSCEVYSESAAYSPLYESPALVCGESQGVVPGVLDRLAVAGVMVATEELDRLSFIADHGYFLYSRARTTTHSGSASAANAPPNTPVQQSRPPSGIPSGMATPLAPDNSPLSGTSTLAARPCLPNHAGKPSPRRRTARSRLSEVCIPEGIGDKAGSLDPAEFPYPTWTESSGQRGQPGAERDEPRLVQSITTPLVMTS